MKYANLYTAKGDTGMTDLWSGGRVLKNHFRIKAVGKIDTFHATLGLCHQYEPSSDHYTILKEFLHKVQTDLTKIMGVIASETIKDGFVVEFDVMNQFLYKHIVKYAEWLDDQSIKQQGWKMYGEGGAAAAQYDYTTTICREVEIMIYDLENVYGMTISDGMKQYFNMLSKVLYLIARIYEHQDDIK